MALGRRYIGHSDNGSGMKKIALSTLGIVLEDQQIAGPSMGVQIPDVVAPDAEPITPPQHRIDGNTAYFTTDVLLPHGQHQEIAVRIDGDDLHFFPERSAAHRQLLAQLGLG